MRRRGGGCRLSMPSAPLPNAAVELSPAVFADLRPGPGRHLPQQETRHDQIPQIS
jgi:hypothetical protein